MSRAKVRGLEGKRVVVTGAARGIGAATARALAEQGASVALVGLEPALLREHAEAIGHRAAWFEADVTDAGAVRAAIDGAAARFGGIDAVFANAGIANFATLRSMQSAQMRRVLEVNVLGLFHTIHSAVPHLVASRGYVLVNASAAAAIGPPGFGAYAASKAGAEAMADVLRQEVRHAGVDVGVCYFSFIDTDMVRASQEHPAFRYLRERLPPPVRTTLPLAAAVDGVLRGIARRSPRVVVPGTLKAVLPLRWLLSLRTPRQTGPLVPEVERLCAEADAAFGGTVPTTEDPEALVRAVANKTP